VSWKHVTAIVVGVVLIAWSGVMLLLCGRSAVCSNPAAFAAVAQQAMAIAGAGGMVITGAYGHAQGGKSSPSVVSTATQTERHQS
jgi:hypothetical protein